MIPARLAPVLLGLILSGLMSLIVSGIATFRALGAGEGLVVAWMESWAVAFPTVLVVAPLARRLVVRIVSTEGKEV